MDTVFVLTEPESTLATILTAITAWVPIGIAGLAVWFTMSQGRRAQQHNKKTVTPHLSFVREFGPNAGTIRFGFKNNGLGPAIIRRYVLRVGGKDFDACKGGIPGALNEAGLFQAVGVHGMAEGEYLTPDDGNYWTFSIEASGPDEAKELSSRMLNISAAILYESVYGDTYTQPVGNDPPALR